MKLIINKEKNNGMVYNRLGLGRNNNRFST